MARQPACRPRPPATGVLPPSPALSRPLRGALKLHLADGRYDDVVREAQEAVELLPKGTCRFIGIDLPRLHDQALPVAHGGAERGVPAFYGDEDDDIPASELFERSDADRAIADVEFLLGL